MSGGAVSVIDLANIDGAAELAVAVKEALSTTGFIFIKNHGMEKDADEMFRISENFFLNETEEEKIKAQYKDNRGYTKLSQEKLDPSETAPDLKEGFNCGFISPTEPPVASQVLPALLKDHASAIAAFQLKCHKFCQMLLEAFALSINLDKDFFTSQHAHGPEQSSLLRFLHYPAIPAGVQTTPCRASSHSDYGSTTLLFQRTAGSEGLQILPSTESLESGNWKDVGAVEGALLVNVGDALEFWSGAHLKSTLHRVWLPQPIPPEGVPERFSMAWFNQPSPDAVFKCVVPTSDISQNDLERMKKKGATPGVEITSQEHLMARLAATYQT
ncbi:Clavaminate synthase-like protein [Meredithblackwellia eburnea MCA 4105]